MPRRFVTLDVFTDQALAGNPLAVVLDAEGLDDAGMQAIAREFNLSETVFVLPPDERAIARRLRIFTPGRELPFAGHPTVGTAVLLALRTAAADGAVAFGLEEKVGIVPCVVEIEGEGRGHARFRVPRLPEIWGDGRDRPSRLGARARSAGHRLRPPWAEPSFGGRGLRFRAGAPPRRDRAGAAERGGVRARFSAKRSSRRLRLHA